MKSGLSSPTNRGRHPANSSVSIRVIQRTIERLDSGKSSIRLIDLGHLGYAPTAEIQRQTLEQVANKEVPNTLFLVEHDPVLTLGANFHAENLLLSKEEYQPRGIEVTPTERGGDVTFHGPKQLVIYPVFNVAEFGKDLHKWLRDLEETMILTCKHFGLTAVRNDINSGAWIDNRKVAAIGIKVRRWVSMHGIALNCNNDLSPFDLIVPCGVRGYGVTSLSQEAGREITIEDAKPVVVGAFEQVFGISLRVNKMSQ